jgi:hypothetical protein
LANTISYRQRGAENGNANTRRDLRGRFDVRSGEQFRYRRNYCGSTTTLERELQRELRPTSQTQADVSGAAFKAEFPSVRPTPPPARIT